MIETNKVYQGDSKILLKEIPNNFIDLTITSPPYDNLRDYKGYSFDFEDIAKELHRVTKEGGVVVWIVNDQTINGSETGTSFRQVLFFMECGFNLHDTMIWEKSFPPQNSNRYEPRFEYMFILSKGTPKTFNPIMEMKRYKDNRKSKKVHRNRRGEFQIGKPSKRKDKQSGNIWYFPVGGGIVTKDKIAYQHPAIFPDDLVHCHIISWSNKGDLVLDPFAGSGTTLKVAKLMGRNYLGFEIAEEYIPLINERLKQETLVHFQNTQSPSEIGLATPNSHNIGLKENLGDFPKSASPTSFNLDIHRVNPKFKKMLVSD